MLKKICFLSVVFLVSLFLSVGVVLAADDLAPEKNPLCWRKKDCEQQRQEIMSDGLAAQGWIQEDPCTGDWGKCLAGSITETQIKFGGQKTFLDAGQFIKVGYNWAIRVVGILATVVIIISGLQWAASAGNSETISTAKNRIGGALIGAFIAFMSYVILNTINPATVNLRLPQVWMSRGIAAPPKWCQEFAGIPDNTPLAFDEAWLDTLTNEFNVKSAANYKGQSLLKKDTVCSFKFVLPEVVGQICDGNNCQGVPVEIDGVKQVCGQNGLPCACQAVDANANRCVPAYFGGTVTLSNPSKFADYVSMWAVCQANSSGEITRVARLDSDYVGQFMVKNYAISFSSDLASFAASRCREIEDYAEALGAAGASGYQSSESYTAVGLFLMAEVQDDSFGTTIDDDWLLGKNTCGNGGRPLLGLNYSDVEVGLIQAMPAIREMQSAGKFWTVDELLGGYTCDIDLNPASYPNLDDADTGDLNYYLP